MTSGGFRFGLPVWHEAKRSRAACTAFDRDARRGSGRDERSTISARRAALQRSTGRSRTYRVDHSLLVDGHVEGLSHLFLRQRAMLVVDQQEILAGRRVEMDSEVGILLQFGDT